MVEKRNAYRFLCEEVTEGEGFEYLAVDCLIILNSCFFYVCKSLPIPVAAHSKA